MNETIQELVRVLLKKNSIEECSLSELQNISRQYPYFAPIQLFLSEKMSSQHPSLYQKQLQKTSLYFNNPLWFDYLLNKVEYQEMEEGNLDRGHNREIDSEIIEYPQKNDNGSLATVSEEDNPSESNEMATLETQHGEMIHPTAEESAAEEKSEKLEASWEEPASFEPTPVENAGGLTEQQQIIPQKTEQKVEAVQALMYEPFHTVDYFASQGIRISAEEIPKDRLGQQLKSFTEWLKTMKRLPETEISKNIDVGAEQKVQSLAEYSIQVREVLTEAMAEVWEKQGDRQKAIEIYNKLSLLNPPKSAYFAAKIEQLKEN